MLRRTFLAALAPARTRLRVGTFPYPALAPFFMGHESGYFASEGLDLDVVRAPDVMQGVPLIVGGKLDVAFLSSHPALFNAVQRGARIRIVAGREVASLHCRPVGTVCVKRQSFPNGLRDLRPLKGKKVSVMGAFGGITHYALDALLAGCGMTPDDVEVVRLGAAESVAALLSGHVAGVVFRSSDFGVRTDAAGLARGPALAQVQPGFQFSWIVFGPRLLDAGVETGVRFLRAYLRGAGDYLRGRTPAFLDELARSQGVDPKAIRAECRDTFAPDGALRFDHLQRFVRWTVAKGFCPAGLDPASLVDTRFLAAMNGDPRRD